jgi:tetratricopeptide (TPR) repeat protein
MSPPRRPAIHRISNHATNSAPKFYAKLKKLALLAGLAIALAALLLTRSGDIEDVAEPMADGSTTSSVNPDIQINTPRPMTSPVMLDIQPGEMLSKPGKAVSPDFAGEVAEAEPVEPVATGGNQRANLSPIFTPYTHPRLMLSEEERLPLAPSTPPNSPEEVPPELQAVLATSPADSIRQDWRRVLAGGRLASAPAGKSSMPSVLDMFGPAPRLGDGGFLPFGPTEKLDQQDAMSRVMFLVREADTAMTKGSLEDALDNYLEALGIYPQMSYANQQAGRLHLLLRRYREAIRFFEAALAASTELGEILNDLGVAHLYAGQTDKALENFEAALQAEPDARDPMFNIGLVYQRLGRAEEARDQFETCIRIMPDDARAYRELAILEVMANDRDSALYRLQQAITVDPAWPQPVLDAALLHAENGNHERAFGLLEVALEIAPVRVVYQVYQQPAFHGARLSPGGQPFEERLARKAREQMRGGG